MQRCTTANQVVDTTADYTLHPAFANESSISFRNGGWDSELTGFWVAKFEAGYANKKADGTYQDGTTDASGNKNKALIKSSSVNYTQAFGWVPVKERNNTDLGTTETDVTTDGYAPARNWLNGVYGEQIDTSGNVLNDFGFKEGADIAIKYPTFQGSTYAMNYISHNDAYNIAKVLTEAGNIYGLSNDSDSHLMKNSEWGAVAYLAQSDYGLGTADITVNSKNLNPNTTEKWGSVYTVTGHQENGTTEWNIAGNKTSTTGNITGVFDFSGGLWERTSSYVNNRDSNLKTYGASIAITNGTTFRTKSTKYITLYPMGEGNTRKANLAALDTGTVNTSSNKIGLIYGDAIWETCDDYPDGDNKYSNSWHGDRSNFPFGGSVFFIRGETYGDIEAWCGLFAFHGISGMSTSYYGLRASLV